MNRRLALLVPAATLALLMSLTGSQPADAAYPGANGMIAFESRLGAIAQGIFVINANGSGRRQLTTFGHAPSWSPDGQRIAFGGGLVPGIFVVNADGSGLTTIRSDVSTAFVRWSPDGGRLAYLGEGGITIWDITSSTETVVTSIHPNGNDFAWSPDGTKMVFGRFQSFPEEPGGRAALWVVNVDGSGLTSLTDGRVSGAPDIAPDWSPDGSTIVYTGNGGIVGGSGIHVLNADGTGVPAKLSSGSSPAWSADGSKIVAAGGDIFVMDRDGSNRQQLTATSEQELSPDWQPLGGGEVSFDWTVPARFGGDADDDGMLDYFAPDGSLEIQPAGFRVDFTAGTVGSCDTQLSHTWSIDGQALAASDPRVITLDDCLFSYSFAEEGTYEVTLELERADGTLLGFKTHQVVVQDFLIVSLGDSVASGEGNPDLPQAGGPERWQDQQCHRTAFAGPAQAALRMEQADAKTSVTFVHLACAGATVEEGMLGSYGGAEPGPLLPPQVQEMKRLAGDREIDAVLVSVGANDVQFATLIFRCFTQPLCDRDRPGSAASLFEQKIVRLPDRYEELDLALQPPDVPTGRIYISEYFDPTRNGSGGLCDSILADHPAGGGLFQITAEEAQWASENMLVRLNAEVFGATVEHGWRYAGGITSQFLTHGYCAPLNWVATYSESMLEQGDERGTLHPNRPGHLAYASRLAAQLRTDLYESGDLGKPRPPR